MENQYFQYNPQDADCKKNAEVESSPSYILTFMKLGATAVVLGSFLVIINNNSIMSSNNYRSQMLSSSSVYTIAVEVESPGYTTPISLSQLPWDVLVEPYREQYISITSFIVDDEEIDVTDSTSYTVTWSLCDSLVTDLSGQEVTFTISDFTGVCSSTVTITDNTVTTSDESNIYEYSFLTAVKYIRREIRTLTDEHRTTFFDALSLMYSVDQVPGKVLYGEKFNTAEYYSYKHLNGAGTTDCDHWHDGAGIITHHMAFTLEVEQTLQAIDPTLSMPYWEYGMDTYLYDNWWNSPVFDADWFGEAVRDSTDHFIQDGGRFDGIVVPDGDAYSEWCIADTGTLNPFVNGYGHMRSPWNNNPKQNIGRHNETYGKSQYSGMPTCSTLQSCFKSDSLSDMNNCLNGATHGPVHILIGGSWGQGTLFDDNNLSFLQSPDKLLFFKVLWRMGLTRCPSTCSYGSACKCSVPQAYIDTYGAYSLLEITNIVYGLSSHLTAYPDTTDDIYLRILRAVEDPGIAGDMFSSTAAFDPTFWPLHGAMERLVDLKRIMVSQGEITAFDDTWGFPTYNKYSGAAYLDGVCDWSKVAGSGDLTLPTCTLDTTCFGHNENDLLEFSGFISEEDAYTNADFYAFMHPWSDTLPYTYDTFDYDYCEDDGSYFNAYDDVVADLQEGLLPMSSTNKDSITTTTSGDIEASASSSSSTTTTAETVLALPMMSVSPTGRKSSVSSKQALRKSQLTSTANKASSKAMRGSATTEPTAGVAKQAAAAPDSNNRLTHSFEYKGFAKGQSQPTWSQRTASKVVNSQPIAATKLLSESINAQMAAAGTGTGKQ